jgi:hypothetical protein
LLHLLSIMSRVSHPATHMQVILTSSGNPGKRKRMAYRNSSLDENPRGAPHPKTKITAVTLAGVTFQLQLENPTWGLPLPIGHRGA